MDFDCMVLKGKANSVEDMSSIMCKMHTQTKLKVSQAKLLCNTISDSKPGVVKRRCICGNKTFSQMNQTKRSREYTVIYMSIPQSSIPPWHAKSATSGR